MKNYGPGLLFVVMMSGIAIAQETVSQETKEPAAEISQFRFSFVNPNPPAIRPSVTIAPLPAKVVRPPASKPVLSSPRIPVTSIPQVRITPANVHPFRIVPTPITAVKVPTKSVQPVSKPQPLKVNPVRPPVTKVEPVHITRVGTQH